MAEIGIACFIGGFFSCIVLLMVIVVFCAPALEHREEMQYRRDQSQAHWGEENQRPPIAGDDGPQ